MNFRQHFIFHLQHLQASSSSFPSPFPPYSPSLVPVFRSTKGILRLIRYADIRAILEFQKPRASFASFANKFVYRGIAAGLVPPVSLRQSRSHTLCPSLRRPRYSLSQPAVDWVREREERQYDGSIIKDGAPRGGGAEGGTEVTRNGVENVKICAEVHSKKKAVDSCRAAPAGWRDKSSQSSPSLSSLVSSLATLSAGLPSTTPLSSLERSRGRFKETGALEILRLLFSNPDSAFVPHKSRVTHADLIIPTTGIIIRYILYDTYACVPYVLHELHELRRGNRRNNFQNTC